QVIRWYQGEELIRETSGWQSDWVEIDSNARTQFRVTNDVSRDASWGTTTSTSTEWTFWTAQPEDWTNLLPFLQVDFAVDTDLSGNAASGPEDVIGLSAWHLPDVADAGEIESATLEIS